MSKSKPNLHTLVLARDLVPSPLGSLVGQSEKILAKITNSKVKKGLIKEK